MRQGTLTSTAGGPWDPAALVGVALLASSAATCMLRHCMRKQQRRSWRPYKLEEAVADPLAELTRAIEWLQETLVLPVNSRLPGSPFEHDIQLFPFTPMVLVIGNHSSGKSTFINHLLGINAQDTGVAPTDDGFTVLERCHTADVEDGPTLLGCTENRPFRELQRFGRAFSGHLRRKRLVLPESAALPFGLQIVDTPGMIDMPGNNQVSAKSRGYNFVEVVRWWAKRADLILLLFDPDKPGTTGETLEVLTKSLAGLEHKFVIVLNKVDRLDNAVDFARAYGTLGWALSKVIPQKDIPQIWTTYNPDMSRLGNASDSVHSLPLEAFRAKREEVVTEVLRARVRHWDNVITAFEETLRQIEMVVSVCRAVRSRAVWHLVKIWTCGLPALVLPGLAGAWLLNEDPLEVNLPEWAMSAIWAMYTCFFCAISLFLWDYGRQCNQLQVAQLDSCFQDAYAHLFVHTDGEDHRLRWCVVRPKIENLLRAVRFTFALPKFSSWEASRISECLEKDLLYLRRLAKAQRPPEPHMATSSRCTQSRSPTPAKVSQPLSEPSSRRATERPTGPAAPDAPRGASAPEQKAEQQPVVDGARVPDRLGRKSGSASSSSDAEAHTPDTSPVRRKSTLLNTILEEDSAATSCGMRCVDSAATSPDARRAKSDALQQQFVELDRELAAARRQADSGARRQQSLEVDSPTTTVSLSSPPRPALESMPTKERDPGTPGSVNSGRSAGSWIGGASEGSADEWRAREGLSRQPDHGTMEMEVPQVEIGCICGYTCGTAKALERHLARFASDSRHAAHYSLT